MADSKFHHSVYFWLKENGAADEAQKIIDAGRANLAGIPGILRMTLAVPAETSGGPVDNSYAVALLIEFVDKAAHDVYDTHPSHLRFIDECKDVLGRVQVYDSVSAEE